MRKYPSLLGGLTIDGKETMEDDGREVLLAYSSQAVRHFESRELVDLLTLARVNNERLGITGMLLYIDGSFFQVLEGDEEALHALYKAIEADERHGKVIKLIEEPIEKRTFSDWSMGYAKATRSELATIPGLNDFFMHGSSFHELEPGRARFLLEAFREGKWRRQLS
jgi:Sensors of blue-light using FAD